MVALIRDKFDDDAAAVVTAMLATARPYEGSVKVGLSHHLGIGTLWGLQ